MIGAVLDDCSVGAKCSNLGQWYKAVPTALTGAILKGLEARLSKYRVMIYLPGQSTTTDRPER